MSLRHFGPGSLALLGLVFSTSVGARTVVPENDPWCGTRPGLAEEKVAEHRYAQSRRAERLAPQYAARPSEDRNEIAVIEDDGTILLQANPLDIANRTFVFRQSGGGLTQESSATPLSGTPGTPLSLTDDDSTPVALPFAFPLGGRTWNTAHVNTDGNITFDAPDSASSNRSVGRFLTQPRVAPFFEDLNPEISGRILVSSSASAFIVTWDAVPEFGQTQGNSFQVKLEPNGTVTFAYGALPTREAVVGVNPQAGASPKAVDLSAGGATATAGQSLVESFAARASFDDLGATSLFYRTHPDIYDYLVTFNDVGVGLGGGAFAYEITVRNPVEGIGVNRSDFSRSFGSAGTLESYLNMGPISQYPEDPNLTFLGSNTTLDIFGQEAGHRWLAFVAFDDRGQDSNLLLGRDLSHWSYCMDSDASDMEGNDWRDNGNGTFTSVDATARFSLLDQYLMGLRPASDVPPTFFLPEGCTTEAQRSRGPEIGPTLTSSKRVVTVQDIIRAEGARRPAFGQAPTQFKMAFILVVARGAEVSNRTLRKLDNMRRAWNQYFRTATDNRGTIITTLDGGPEDTEPFPDDDGGGDGGGGCGTVGGAGGGGPAGGLGAALLAVMTALVLGRQRHGRPRLRAAGV